LRSPLRGRRAYIDTNVLVYVALKHPVFYEGCYRVLRMLVDGEFEGYGSQLVLFELFGSLARVEVRAAYEAATQYLNLPLRLLSLDRVALTYAFELTRRAGVTYNAVHAGLVARNGLDVVVTEDLEDWGRILRAWPALKRFGVGDVAVYSPTRGFLKGPGA